MADVKSFVVEARSPAGSQLGPASSYAGGCSFGQVRKRLQDAGLRPTRQRVTLGWLLFARGDRHVTAERLYDEVRGSKVPMSLATVYNTLHQFSEAGLLREIALYGSTVWYDTNTGSHFHFYVADKDELVDIPPDMVTSLPLPQAPEGMEIIGADLIIRVRSAQIPKA